MLDIRGGVHRLNSSGTLDLGFDAGVFEEMGGVVSAAIELPNGQILIGGDFTSIAGHQQKYIALLNADGTVDTDFNLELDNSANDIILQSDNKILIGGGFGNVNTVPRGGIARLNSDGSLDSTFIPGESGIIRSIDIQSDGKVLIGGSIFTNVFDANKHSASERRWVSGYQF